MRELCCMLLNRRVLLGCVGLLVMCVGAALAGSDQVNAGDTAWVLASTALVFFMTPGLGLFYAGMVRRKNALATILQSFILCGVVGVTWVVYGFSLAFGSDHGGVIGSFQWIALNGVSIDRVWPGTGIPEQAFMIFQAMFAIITPALISGALAERIRFKAYCWFIVLWATLVYCPVAHWVWQSDGWLFKLGALDFAGGTVVHICSGFSALCAALILGKRKNYGREEFRPHNLTMTLIGTALLWFGWFGFNAGSALGASGLAVNAFVVTNTAAATAMISWVIVEWLHRGKPTALGAASGAVAGLVAITPACGYVNATAALVIGALVSVFCYLAIMMKGKLGYDDSLDVFGIHGVGGLWGAIATGLFATAAVNPAVTDFGLFYGGGFALLGKQMVAILSVVGFAVVVTFIILKLIGLFTPLRVEIEEEETGLDLSQHGEIGYTL